MRNWEAVFSQHVAQTLLAGPPDPAHDHAHFSRVVKTAKRICEEEQARLEIVVPAAWLHDLVNVPKNDPRRNQASRLSAQAAVEFLRTQNFPATESDLAAIAHAVESHSFSAGIEPRTLEAKIVQDADRLDALGAVGIARCFSVAGSLGTPFYSIEDPFGQNREFNDRSFAIDHFYVKLFKIAETLQTSFGRAEGIRRVEFMRSFLQQLHAEIEPLQN